MSKFIGWLAKTSVGSMFGAVPPWIWYGMVALALMMCGGWVNGARWELKYDKHIAADKEAIKAAIDTQAAQNTTAATEFATGAIERDTQIIYRDKEVTKYVKQNNTLTHRGGDDCRVDTGFISVFDGTSTAAKPAN